MASQGSASLPRVPGPPKAFVRRPAMAPPSPRGRELSPRRARRGEAQREGRERPVALDGSALSLN